MKPYLPILLLLAATGLHAGHAPIRGNAEVADGLNGLLKNACTESPVPHFNFPARN